MTHYDDECECTCGGCGCCDEGEDNPVSDNFEHKHPVGLGKSRIAVIGPVVNLDMTECDPSDLLGLPLPW